MKFVYSLILFLTLCYVSLAQTINFPYKSSTLTNHFNAGEFCFSLAPLMSIPSLNNPNLHNSTFGYSFETEYWQTAHTGTGIELGSYNVGNNTFLDHFSINADYRFNPFPTIQYLSSWDVELKSCATSIFTDGSKAVGLGIGLDKDTTLLKHHFRFSFSGVQNLGTTTKNSNFLVKFSIKLFSF